jgi:deoxyribodipyrimidine photo-lyase
MPENTFKILYMNKGEKLTHLLETLLSRHQIQSLSCNVDYSDFSLKRDYELGRFCKTNGIDFITAEDNVLLPLMEKDPEIHQYKKFSPFMNYWASHPIQPVKKYTIKFRTWPSKGLHDRMLTPEDMFEKYGSEPETENAFEGKRSRGITILNSIKKFKNYESTRDMLSENTTGLSSYLNLGLLSIREVYWKMKEHNLDALIRQLLWRDFYIHLYYERNTSNGKIVDWADVRDPSVQKEFQAFKKGETGFPIVDAAIRQMLQTGNMHNRGRMIVASFLTKNLRIDWRHGERFFANHLIDYNIYANNGGWQWTAGTGADSQPFIRIFNPWVQTRKFDPNATFIKKYIPELKDVCVKDILDWENKHINYTTLTYARPICVHSERRSHILNEL